MQLAVVNIDWFLFPSRVLEIGLIFDNIQNRAYCIWLRVSRDMCCVVSVFSNRAYDTVRIGSCVNYDDNNGVCIKCRLCFQYLSFDVGWYFSIFIFRTGVKFPLDRSCVDFAQLTSLYFRVITWLSRKTGHFLLIYLPK